MISVNLIPESMLLAHLRRRHTRRWLVIGIASATLLAAPIALESYRAARAESLDQQWRLIKRELDTLQSELSSVTLASRDTYLQIERARALRTKRSWSSMLGVIASAMPEGCWLTELATDPATPSGGASSARRTGSGPPATAPTDSPESTDQKRTVTIEAPRAIRLIGYAADSSEPLVFVSRLKETGVFRSVNLENAQRQPVADGHYFRFELLCGW
jgi:hypothetical protein